MFRFSDFRLGGLREAQLAVASGKHFGDARDDVAEGGHRQSLIGIGPSSGWIRMDFNQEAIGASGGSGEQHVRNQISAAGSV